KRVRVRLEPRQESRKLRLLRAGAQVPVTVRAPSAVARPKGGPVRVLVADDDPAIVRMLELRLRAEGWEAVHALDGEQAEKLIETDSFDLILLDLNMPFRSGFDVLEWMSQRGLKRHAKIA